MSDYWRQCWSLITKETSSPTNLCRHQRLTKESSKITKSKEIPWRVNTRSLSQNIQYIALIVLSMFISFYTASQNLVYLSNQQISEFLFFFFFLPRSTVSCPWAKYGSVQCEIYVAVTPWRVSQPCTGLLDVIWAQPTLDLLWLVSCQAGKSIHHK